MQQYIVNERVSQIQSLQKATAVSENSVKIMKKQEEKPHAALLAKLKDEQRNFQPNSQKIKMTGVRFAS